MTGGIGAFPAGPSKRTKAMITTYVSCTMPSLGIVSDSAEAERSLGSVGRSVGCTSTTEALEPDGLVSASPNSVGGNAFNGSSRSSVCVPQAPVPIQILPDLTIRLLPFLRK
jgi:hypothetical protein